MKKRSFSQMISKTVWSTYSNKFSELQRFYTEKTQEVLRKKVGHPTQNQVLLRPLPDVSDSSHSLHTIYVRTVFESMNQIVLGFKKTSIVWYEILHDYSPLFAGMVQVYTNKTTTSLKGIATVAHPEHAVLVHVNLDFCLYLINHGYTFVGL